MTAKLRHTFPMTALTVTFTLAASPALRGADESDPEYVVLQTAELRVVVKDDENRPVAGAAVSPTWITMHEEPYCLYCGEIESGFHETKISNAQGFVVLRCPSLIWNELGVWTPRSLDLRVTHPEFAVGYSKIPLDRPEAGTTLTPGGKAHFTAVDSLGNSVKDFGVMVFPGNCFGPWTAPESGGRRCGAIPAGTWQFMLAKPQDDGPTLFSSVMPLQFAPRKKVLVNNVVLTPGVTLRGKLDSNVPRPITGHVLAVSMPQPINGTWHGTEWPLTWVDWTEIRPNGTFEFKSLPRGGKIQLIARCEEWISATSFPNWCCGVKGQAFDAEGDRVDVELIMEPTGTVEVQVVDKAGQPVTAESVSFSIWQYYDTGATDQLGALFRSSTEIKNQFLPPDCQLPYYDTPIESLLSVPLDENGVARIGGLPLAESTDFWLLSDHSQLEANALVDELGTFSVTLDSTEPVRIKVTAVPKQ